MHRLRVFSALQLIVGSSPTVPMLSRTNPEAGYLIYGSTGNVPGASSYAPQWLRGGVAISGATNWFYEVQEADIGELLSLQSTPNAGSPVTSLAYTVTRAPVPADISTYAQDRYNTATRRYDFVLHGSARAILMDGTSDAAAGQIYHAATPAAAFALARAGMADWVLFPSGQTSTTGWGVVPAALSGISGSYPAVIGTFDPADPTNPAKWNKGPRHDLNREGIGRGAGAVLNLNANPRNHLAVTNLKIRVHTYEAGTFVQALNARNGLLFDNVVLFGCVFQIQQSALSYTQSLPASGSGNQSVFVFTVRGKSSASNPWRIERITRSGGARLAYTEGVDYTIAKGATVGDYSDGVTVTLTTPVDIGLYQIKCFVTHENLPDSQASTDIVLNRCASMYGNDQDMGRGGAQYFYGTKRVSVADMAVHHCGWGKTHTRSTTGVQHGAFTSSDGVQTVFTYPALQATIETGISEPNGVYRVGRYTSGGSWLAWLVPVTEYSISIGTPAANITTGVTVTLVAPITAGQKIGVTPFVNGPDIFKHNWYLNDYCDAVLYRVISSWDSANAKMTGKVRLKEWTELSSPIGPIVASWGNVYEPYPDGTVEVIEDYLQVGSDDIFLDTTPLDGVTNNNSAGRRGWGPRMYVGTAGSNIQRAVMLRQDNPSSAGRVGLISGANNQNTPSFIDVTKLVVANWNHDEGQGTSGSGANLMTRTYTDCVTDISIAGTNNILRSALPPGARKTAVDEALARNMHTTFRQAMNISVTVDADNKVTEDRVMEYICNNIDQRLWSDLIRYHFNADIITA